MSKALLFLATCSLLSLSGCSATPPAPHSEQIANPASEYCIGQGGKLELRNEAPGVTGYCHLPDGRVEEEWRLYHSEVSLD